MNDLEYLNQIAAANRPVKQKGTGLKALFSSTIVKVIIGLVAVLIAVVIFGSMLGKVSKKEKNLLIQINMRMNNLQSSIQYYNQHAKSARLRGMGVSLSSTLAESSRDLYAVLEASYEYKNGGEVDTEVTTAEAEHKAELDQTLANAKLNGILDRTYVHRLAYETSLLMSMELEAVGRTKNEGVQGILNQSIKSLELLEEQLSNYSDSTN